MTLDLVIVCMPLFVISRLHMDKKQKWAVGGIFMMGALASCEDHSQTGNVRSDEHRASSNTWRQFDLSPRLEERASRRSDRVFEDKTKLLADTKEFQLQISLPSESPSGLKRQGHDVI
ncbi:MAG: hypothetical protein Q9196_002507 [Gyalolechia fulgens]